MTNELIMQWHIAHALIVGTAMPIAICMFGLTIYRKYQIMMACENSLDPVDNHRARIKGLLTLFLGQKKLFQEFAPGVMHAVIFWGFFVLLLRVLTLFGMAFTGFDYHLPLLNPETLAGQSYSLMRDIANFAVAAMVVYALVRRYVLKVPRLLNTPSSLFVLLMILSLMLSDMLFASVQHASRHVDFQVWAPVGSLLGPYISAGYLMTPGNWATAGHLAFLFHCLGILIFLVYVPMGKHMHILTAAFNIYLRPMRSSGRLTKLDLEDENAEVFGTPWIENLTWKDVLDLYTCTECGRCDARCPAVRTHKSLGPREVTLKQRNFLLEEAPRILSGDEPVREMVPDAISAEEVWACTTCDACEQACPVNISYIQRINSMRRSEVLMKGEVPTDIKRVFKGMAANANPWGFGPEERLAWAKDLDIPLYGENGETEYLLFLGCAASFDDRAQKISRSLITLLNECGVSYGTLGEREACCGETARRLGEELLGQTLIQGNVASFDELGVKKILTPCPHCFNTFKNEYPDFDGQYEVIHHSQLIQELIQQGALAPTKEVNEHLVIHDSCYMNRINDIPEPPREILASIPNADFTEPVESNGKGFCCGAGGGRFWLEESEPRINHERLKQLMETDPTMIATSCPYCTRMLSDAAKDLGHDEVQVLDVAEIVELAL